MKTKAVFHRAVPTWCRGCGLFGIFDALKRAASALDLEPENLAVVTGIGCHGRLNNYFFGFGFHGLHGRTMPVAAGIELASPGLQVIAVSGDGDAYSIGLGHFIHTLRKNVNLTYLVSNNRLYALTEGQASPTTDFGMVTLSTPFGSKDYPVEGPPLALAAGGTFIARGFSGDVAGLAGLIEKGMSHNGFALIDILSPCVTHNKINTYEWYRNHTFQAQEEPGYNPKDKAAAWRILHHPEKIALGLIYSEEKPSFDRLILPDFEKPIALTELAVDVPRLQKIMEKFR